MLCVCKKLEWTKSKKKKIVSVNFDRHLFSLLDFLTLEAGTNGLSRNFGKDLPLYDAFGGLGVACWPLVPKFAGSNPAEVVRFLGRKNPQHTFLRRGSKAVGPMS